MPKTIFILKCLQGLSQSEKIPNKIYGIPWFHKKDDERRCLQNQEWKEI